MKENPNSQELDGFKIKALAGVILDKATGMALCFLVMFIITLFIIFPIYQTPDPQTTATIFAGFATIFVGSVAAYISSKATKRATELQKQYNDFYIKERIALKRKEYFDYLNLISNFSNIFYMYTVSSTYNKHDYYIKMHSTIDQTIAAINNVKSFEISFLSNINKLHDALLLITRRMLSAISNITLHDDLALYRSELTYPEVFKDFDKIHNKMLNTKHGRA